jgi:concentrative nucleoside transporter, CNT family
MSGVVEEKPPASDGARDPEMSDHANISESTGFQDEKAKSPPLGIEVQQVRGDDRDLSKETRSDFYAKCRPFILGGLAALILGWWISATVLRETRHRW